MSGLNSWVLVAVYLMARTTSGGSSKGGGVFAVDALSFVGLATATVIYLSFFWLVLSLISIVNFCCSLCSLIYHFSGVWCCMISLVFYCSFI